MILGIVHTQIFELAMPGTGLAVRVMGELVMAAKPAASLDKVTLHMALRQMAAATIAYYDVHFDCYHFPYYSPA